MARKKEAKKVDVDTIAQTETPKKRAGRKPMTAEEKAAASKKRTEEKAKADSLSPILILQYMGEDIDTTALVEAAKTDFKATHILITMIRNFRSRIDQGAVPIPSTRRGFSHSKWRNRMAASGIRNRCASQNQFSARKRGPFASSANVSLGDWSKSQHVSREPHALYSSRLFRWTQLGK